MSFTPTTARRAALEKWSRTDARQGTARARAASPGSLDYWLSRDGAAHLPHAERIKRAERARRAHFLRLSEASALARRGGSV
jgi:hypothetical protein